MDGSVPGVVDFVDDDELLDSDLVVWRVSPTDMDGDTDADLDDVRWFAEVARRIGQPLADCDMDGIPDSHAIAIGLVDDLDQDGRPDECAPLCLADANGDGLVTPADFNAWVIAFNSHALECDQNGDGLCSPADFNAWVLNFNAGCP
ncbi:MAG: GC-type dockerin domain-anchored protein [Cyanobacteria bacterium J06648_11]